MPLKPIMSFVRGGHFLAEDLAGKGSRCPSIMDPLNSCSQSQLSQILATCCRFQGCMSSGMHCATRKRSVPTNRHLRLRTLPSIGGMKTIILPLNLTLIPSCIEDRKNSTEVLAESTCTPFLVHQFFFGVPAPLWSTGTVVRCL